MIEVKMYYEVEEMLKFNSRYNDDKVLVLVKEGW